MASPSQYPATHSHSIAYNSLPASERTPGGTGMTENWKRWEGRVVGEKFPLTQYLGGEQSGVFLSEPAGAARVAIKLVPVKPETADEQLARWERVASLSHPHLLRVLQWGRCEFDGSKFVYLTTEYAEENLSQILPVRALNSEEARQMLEPALDALAYLCARGYAHGRIKPTNILAANDQLKLSSDSIVKSGEVVGNTPARSPYAAPESADGRALPSGDIWSLGMVLVEVLTQKLPTWDPMAQSEPVVPPTLPAPFFDIARNCLRVDPQRRWAAGEITARLRTPAPSQIAAQKESARDAIPNRWRYAIPVVVAGIILAVVMAAKMRDSHREGAAAPQTAAEPPRTQPEAVNPTAEKQPAKPKAGRATHADSSAAALPPAPAQASAAGEKASVGSSFPGVVHPVIPAASQGARNTIQGKVRVRVKVNVDAAGNVTQATFESPGPSQYFARLAMEAAQQWKFAPAPAGSEWTLRFAFGRGGTEAFPVQNAR